ncbi:MAG: MMPL family transporter, partial [Gammaproteobacteria bacterium]
ALLVWLWRPIAADRVREFTLLHNTLQRIINFTQVRDGLIFWSCTLFAVVTLALLPLNDTDFNRLDFIANDAEITAYYDAVGEHMNRGPTLAYAIDTGAIDGAIDPEFLRNVEQFGQWLASQDDVESAASLVDVVKAADVVLGTTGSSGTIPAELERVAFYLDAYATVENPDFPLSGFINNDYSMITLVVNATPTTNQGIIDLDRRLSGRFAESFPSAQLIHGSGVLLFARMDELVTVELLQGYGLSLVLITLCMSIGLRSFYFGVLSVIPNLLPATMVFGVWALFVGQVDPFVMMLFSISLGLVVDDSVHILSHYLDDRRRGTAVKESIAHSIRIAGPALTITTLVLAFGTTILIGANTVYFQQAAKLLVPIVILALALDLIFLPTVLKRFDKGVQADAA